MSDEHSGAGEVALVTGGGRRVGRVVARHLAANYRLVVHANASASGAKKTVDEIRAAGGDAIALTADLCDEQATRRMVAEAYEHYGRIDALVNCAAIWKAKPLEQVTADDVRAHFEINTLATFVCCQAVGLIMVGQHDGGSIVNIGDWAIIRPYVDHAAYFPSKGAIPTLTRTFAVGLAKRNPRIRVNAILPGPVMLSPDLPAAAREAAVRGTLVHRAGRPENVAHAVSFLLENDFVTGVCLPVDGGRSIFSGEFEQGS